MRRLACSGLCALAAILAAAQPAATTAAASWSLQPSPNVRTFSNFLAGVAATSASNAWAVGEYFKPGTGQTLIEHWNGQRWAAQPSPNASSADGLAGVAATSASNAWAVGSYQDGTAPDRTLIEHWNGRSWAIQPSPSGGTGFSDLYGVAATSAANAWAVGRTLIEHWNGRRWAVQPSPTTGNAGAVTAASASNAWAVGSYQNSTPPGRTFIEHWNGRRWIVQPSPSVGSEGNHLNSVAATSASNAWAVGSYRGISRTLVLYRD
jgi:hypothetical protein